MVQTHGRFRLGSSWAAHVQARETQKGALGYTTSAAIGKTTETVTLAALPGAVTLDASMEFVVGMARWAVSFLGIQRSSAKAAHEVHGIRDGLQMPRIAAAAITAEMVKDETVRNRADEMQVTQPVHNILLPFGLTGEPCLCTTVTVRRVIPRPSPALFRWIGVGDGLESGPDIHSSHGG